MSIANEIQRLQDAKADIADAIVAKGGEVSGTLDTYAQAIEALPSGGGGSVAVLEGEITLASSSLYNLKIEHNLGVVPFMAVVDVQGEYEPQYNKVILLRNFVDIKDGIYSMYYNSSLAITSIGGLGNPTMIFNEDFVQMFTSSASRTFYPQTYHYKIYYEI